MDDNYKLRYYSFITSATEEDKTILYDMLIPTEEELQRNTRLNEEAK